MDKPGICVAEEDLLLEEELLEQEADDLLAAQEITPAGEPFSTVTQTRLIQIAFESEIQPIPLGARARIFHVIGNA